MVDKVGEGWRRSFPPQPYKVDKGRAGVGATAAAALAKPSLAAASRASVVSPSYTRCGPGGA